MFGAWFPGEEFNKRTNENVDALSSGNTEHFLPNERKKVMCTKIL